VTKREMIGFIDEYGFPCLKVNVIDPITKNTITDLKAIIDTGAAYSHIKPHIIKALDLKPIDNITIKHITDGEINSDIFKINIKLNEKYMIPEVKIRIITQEQYPSDLIIGIDILKHCNFIYNSVEKSFTLILFPTVPDPQE
jgi:predicted aspartyl protease